MNRPRALATTAADAIAINKITPNAFTKDGMTEPKILRPSMSAKAALISPLSGAGPVGTPTLSTGAVKPTPIVKPATRTKATIIEMWATIGRREMVSIPLVMNCSIRPVTPPMTGRYTSATTKDADKTKISVTGNMPMNWPGTPGQNSIGRKAQSVVAVDEITGQNMRLAAST